MSLGLIYRQLQQIVGTESISPGFACINRIITAAGFDMVIASHRCDDLVGTPLCCSWYRYVCGPVPLLLVATSPSRLPPKETCQDGPGLAALAICVPRGAVGSVSTIYRQRQMNRNPVAVHRIDADG